MGCLPRVVEAVEEARRKGVPVFYVVREHDPSGIDIERTRTHLFARGGGAGATVQGTEGAELVAPLTVQPGDQASAPSPRPPSARAPPRPPHRPGPPARPAPPSLTVRPPPCRWSSSGGSRPSSRRRST